MIHLVINRLDFDSQMDQADKKLIVIFFMYTWCGPCRIMSPVVNRLSDKYEDKVLFLKVDTDELEDIAREYNITGYPTFIFVKNKSKLDELVGAYPDRLKDMVNRHT
ncbi:thioredoxin-2-like [Centruroides vittatus]|uniref:thioredoxin-2-like n=1 Tax=Centruroides vittatus TaxID=120091 RepID=UPI00350F9FBC